MTSDKREIEIALEDWMHETAKERLRKDSIKAQKREAWGESRLGKAFVTGYARPFVESVEAFLQPRPFGARGSRAAEMLRKSELEPAMIAYLFVKGIFNMLPKMEERALKKSPLSYGVKRPSLCIYAVGLIHDQWRISVFDSVPERKKLLKVIMEDMEKRGYPRHWKLRTIRNQFRAWQVDWEGWTTKEKLQIGHALLGLFMSAFPSVLVNPVNREGKVDKTRIEASDSFYETVEKTFEARKLDMILYRPMVVPPRPWNLDHMFRGGYLTKAVKPFGMIIGTKPKDVSRLMSADLSTAFRAINALQETPFRINRRVFEAFEWAIRTRQGGIAGLAETTRIPLPDIPWDYETNPETKKAHNHRVFLIHDKNRQNKSKALTYFATFLVADKYKEFDEFYFPHFFDHRGRTYPKVVFLQPQSADYSKAMLEFARGRVVGTVEAYDWIRIACANAYGNDKISLRDRVQWTVDNTDMIRSIASDPYTDLRWTHASEPFQFLRACFEIDTFIQAAERREPFVSHMVIPVDATCSGLQHYAAMLADEVGGRSVNLVPGLSRQDVYGDVAARVREILSSNDCDEARALIRFGIDRKTVKRQVMVVPYAATMSSCMAYTRAAIAEKLDSGVKPEWDTSDRLVHNTHIVLLAKTIWEAIQDVVLKGREAMQWLSAAARAWSKWANENNVEDPAIEWTLPDGFPVRHVVFEETKKRVESHVDGGVKLTYYEPTKKVSSTDMATSFPPNFIHSYDACHLRMSIVRALDIGITDFDMVHDSFGVHAACMTDFLTKCVKPAFIDMYGSSDRLRELRDSLPPDLDLPPLPERGTLDLNGVASSEFFFS
jgi:DNA-directed RNA polymerase